MLMLKIIKELLKEMHINKIARKSLSEALVLPVEEEKRRMIESLLNHFVVYK